MDSEGGKTPATLGKDYFFVGKAPSDTIRLTGKAVTYSYKTVSAAGVLDAAAKSLEAVAGVDYVTGIVKITPKAEGGPATGTPGASTQYDFYVLLASDPTNTNGTVKDPSSTLFTADILDPSVSEDVSTYTPRFALSYGKQVDGKFTTVNRIMEAEAPAKTE